MNFSAVSPPDNDSFLFFDIMLSRRMLNLVILLAWANGAHELIGQWVAAQISALALFKIQSISSSSPVFSYFSL